VEVNLDINPEVDLHKEYVGFFIRACLLLKNTMLFPHWNPYSSNFQKLDMCMTLGAVA
jgi:hypothetical protein